MIRDLMKPEAYPPPRPSSVSLVTTHISWVFLTDSDAWKLKRPVNFGFLDYSTPEKRRHFCHEEVRLNRRLAADVYLGVVPVRLGPDGHSFVGDGPIVDYAVRMRRLPEECSAEALLRRGELTPGPLDRLVRPLLRFYAQGRKAADPGLRANILENIEQTLPFAGRLIDRPAFEVLRDWQLAALDRRAPLLRDRAASGRVRDGHGDLRLEHVTFENDDPIIIDCIEFNERFRVGDIANDVAFLAMELHAKGRPDLGEWLLARLADESQDYDLYGLVDLYLSYRAWVRAKVACFIASDPATPSDKAARKRTEARDFFALASAFARPSNGPLIAVGGMIGSGKSTLAAALSRETGLPSISSDATRKHLSGVAATDRLPDTAYSAAFSRRTFDEFFRRAELVLGSGRGVILDATFRSRDLRARAAALAAESGRPFRFVEMTCDDATLRERLRARSKGPSVSDAGEELLHRLRAEYEPASEFPDRVVIDSTLPLDEQVRRVTSSASSPTPATSSAPRRGS